MSESNEPCHDDPRQTRWALQVAVTILAAAASFALVDYLFDGGHVVGAVRWLLAAIPFVLGIDVMRRYVRYMRRIDELQRLLHMRALAFSFGVGVMVGVGSDLAEFLLGWTLSAALLASLMLVTWGIALLVGHWSYR